MLVSNLGVVRSSWVKMGGEAVIRKAQVQAVIVRDENRASYGRVLVCWRGKSSGRGLIYQVSYMRWRRLMLMIG